MTTRLPIIRSNVHDKLNTQLSDREARKEGEWEERSGINIFVTSARERFSNSQRKAMSSNNTQHKSQSTECSRFHSLQLLNCQAIFLLSSSSASLSHLSSTPPPPMSTVLYQKERGTYFTRVVCCCVRTTERVGRKIKMKVLQTHKLLFLCSSLCQLYFTDPTDGRFCSPASHAAVSR